MFAPRYAHAKPQRSTLTAAALGIEMHCTRGAYALEQSLLRTIDAEFGAKVVCDASSPRRITARAELPVDERAFIANIHACLHELCRVPQALVDTELSPMYVRALSVSASAAGTVVDPMVLTAGSMAMGASPCSDLIDRSLGVRPAVCPCRLREMVRGRSPQSYERYVVAAAPALTGKGTVTGHARSVSTAWQQYLHEVGIVCFRYAAANLEERPLLKLLLATTDLRCCAVEVPPMRSQIELGRVPLAAQCRRRLPAAARYLDEMALYVQQSLLRARHGDWTVCCLLRHCALSLPAVVLKCVRAARMMPRDQLGAAEARLLAACTSPALAEAGFLAALQAARDGEASATVCRLAAAMCAFMTHHDPFFGLLSRTQRREALMWALSWMATVHADDVGTVLSAAVTARGPPPPHPPLIALKNDDARVKLLLRMSEVPLFLRLLPPKMAVRVGELTDPTPFRGLWASIVGAAVADTEATLILRDNYALNLASWVRPVHAAPCV